MFAPESRDDARHGLSWGRTASGVEALAEFTMKDEMSDEFSRHALVKGALACCVDIVFWRCVRLVVAGAAVGGRLNVKWYVMPLSEAVAILRILRFFTFRDVEVARALLDGD